MEHYIDPDLHELALAEARRMLRAGETEVELRPRSDSEVRFSLTTRTPHGLRLPLDSFVLDGVRFTLGA